MSSPSQVAAGFTITGLLDGASRTRGRYPVSEIAVADIADHPANAAYSMDPAGIAELAESIVFRQAFLSHQRHLFLSHGVTVSVPLSHLVA